VLADRLCIAEIVIVVDEALLEPFLRGTPDHEDIEGQRGKRTGNGSRIHHYLWRFCSFSGEPRKVPLPVGKRDESLPVKEQHKPPADHIFWIPVRLSPIPEASEFL
jgi:hypothetical protein